MSNVKTTDLWTTVRTVLEKNPGLSAKYLIKQLRGKTGLSRSTIYEHLSSFELRGRIQREKGKYWLKKPDEENLKDVTGSQLLKQLEEKLGSKVDLTALRLLVESLTSFMHAGARISSSKAEETKLRIERIINGTEIQVREYDFDLATSDLLDALGVHLKLAVDSLVKR